VWEALAVGGSGLYPLAEGEDAGAAEQRRCLSYCAVALMAEADVVMTAITGTDPSLPAFRFIADPLLHHPDAHSFTSSPASMTHLEWSGSGLSAIKTSATHQFNPLQYGHLVGSAIILSVVIFVSPLLLVVYS